MLQFFSDNFSGCVWLAIFLMSMIPMLESKVAIPFALSKQVWGDAVLSPVVACLVSFAGSMVPALLLVVICKLCKKKFSGFLISNSQKFSRNKIAAKIQVLSQKTTVFQKCIYLAGFVAFPMPFTGLYSGSVIVGFSNLKWWQGVVSLAVGALVSCVGITILCCLFENSAFYIFLFAVAVAVLFAAANMVVWLFKAIKKKRGA